MSHPEILIKAVERAIANGWKPNIFVWIPEDYQALLDYWFTADSYKTVIFNHDFAKALWGENPWRLISKANWQYHLQQMVIAEDPIAYLGDSM